LQRDETFRLSVALFDFLDANANGRLDFDEFCFGCVVGLGLAPVWTARDNKDNGRKPRKPRKSKAQLTEKEVRRLIFTSADVRDEGSLDVGALTRWVGDVYWPICLEFVCSIWPEKYCQRDNAPLVCEVTTQRRFDATVHGETRSRGYMICEAHAAD
jgi:hypothetical protein